MGKNKQQLHFPFGNREVDVAVGATRPETFTHIDYMIELKTR